MRLRSHVLSAALGVVAFALTADDAHASGYLTARFGSDHGSPAAPNTFAIYFNPAALGSTKDTTLTGDLSLALRYVSYNRGRDALSPTPNQRDRLLQDQQYLDANTGKASLLNLVALPFIGVNTDFGTKSFRAGYALYVPFGGMATWSKTGAVPGVPGASDGPQRWHNISGQILALYNTFAAAYNFEGTGFSIGASVSPVIHHVATVRARTADDSDEVLFANGTLKEGRSLLDATGINIAASAGVHWQSPEDGRVKIGLAYLSQPGFGTTRMSGTLDGRTAGGDVKQNIDFLQTYPDIIRLGASYRLPGDKLELRTDGEFVRWSVFDSQCVVMKGKDCNVNENGGGNTTDILINIPRKWRNAVGYRLGAAYFASEQLEVFGSAAFTTSAVPKETIDASTIDSFRLYATIGARYQISRKLALAASYNHIYSFKVDTENRNIFDAQQKPSQSPSADGTYNSQIGMLNANFAYTF